MSSVSQQAVGESTERSPAFAAPIAPNWPLLALLFLIPLQNIYLGKLPSFGGGLNFLNFILLLSFVVWRMRHELAVPTPTTIHGPLYAYMGLFGMSMLYGIHTLGFLGENHVTALKDTFVPFFSFFIVLNSVRDRRGIVWILAATLLPLPYMFRVFYNQVSSYMSWHYSDKLRLVSGTFMELGSNEIAAFYAGYTLLLIALIVYVKPLKLRLPLVALAFINLYSLLYSYSRGSWLSFLAGLVVLGWFINRKLTIIACVAIVAFSGSLITLFPVSVQERYTTIFVENEDERDTSAMSRYWLWEIAKTEFAKSPLFGIGFHVFHHVNPYQGKDTHNYYVKILTEQGLIGMTILLTILWRAWRVSHRLFRSADDGLYKAIGVGMMGCIAAFALGNMFGDRFSHYPLITYFWTYLALVLRAQQLVEQGQREGQNHF